MDFPTIALIIVILAMAGSVYFQIKTHRMDMDYQKQDSQIVDNEKVIDELKTIVFTTTNATGEGDLDSALRLYFEKKSVVENSTDTPY